MIASLSSWPIYHRLIIVHHHHHLRKRSISSSLSSLPEDKVNIQLCRQCVDSQVLSVQTHVGKQVQLVSAKSRISQLWWRITGPFQTTTKCFTLFLPWVVRMQMKKDPHYCGPPPLMWPPQMPGPCCHIRGGMVCPQAYLFHGLRRPSARRITGEGSFREAQHNNAQIYSLFQLSIAAVWNTNSWRWGVYL